MAYIKESGSKFEEDKKKKQQQKQSAAKSSGSSGSSSSAKKTTGSAPANAYSDSGSYQRAQTAKQNRTTGSSQGSGSGSQRSGSGSSYSGSGVKKSTSGAPSVTNYRTDASSSAYNNDGSRKSSYGSSSSGTGSGVYTYGASKQNRELSLERAEHIDVQKRESSVRRRAEYNRRDQALRDQGIDPDDLRRQMAEYLNERDGGRGSTRIKASYETNINSIIKSLSSDSYKDSDDIKKLQDTYAQAQTELNKLKVRGYDVTEAQEQLTQLQKAMREQISYNSTFKNKDDYTISRLAAANSGKSYREIQEQIDQRSRQLGNQGTNVSAENLRDMQRELNWLEQNKYNYMTGNELLSELTKTYEERATEAPNLKERFITGDVSKHTGDRADYDYKIERLKEAISKNVDTGSLPARLWSESDISHNGVTSSSDRLKYAESEYERFVSGLKLQRSDDEKLRKLLADHKTYTYTDGDGNVKTGRAKDLIKEYVARQDYQEGSALNRVFSGGMTGEVTPQFINATNSIVSSLSNAGYNVTAMASAYERYRNEKEAEEREKAIREYVSSGKPLAKTLASAATVATNLAAPAVAALGTLGRAATAGAYDNTRKLADVNDEAFAASRFTSDVRDEVEKQLTAKAKTGFGKAVRSIVYSAGMSLADMAAAFLVAGGIQLGGGATLAELKTEGSAASKAMGRLVQTFMSSSAGTGEFIDSIQNGATMGQAVRTGIAAAVFEAVFEKYSIGMIADAMKATNPIQILTKMCMSFVGEGSEEVATDVANMLADAFINGDNSKFNRSVVEYMKNGDSAATAKAKALADTRKQLWQSFAGGALAGAAGTGITAANAVYYSAREANSKIKADIDTGRDAARAQSGVRSSENAGQTIENLRELTGEAKLSEKEQKKISRDIRKAEKAQAKIGSREQDGKKKTVTKKSAYDIGKAVNDVREASAESAVSQIRRDAIANRISALDRDSRLSSQDVDTLTAAVYEAYVDEKSGKRTSRENISLITNSPAATTVRNELRSAESQRASQWIQDMREAENAARDDINDRAESGVRSAEIQPVGEFAARTSNGEAVTVTAIESTRDGIRVRLSDGTNGIVSSTAHRAVNGQQRDIFFDNEEDGRLFAAAARAGGAAEANAFIASYQPGVDIDQYAREWNEAYTAGLLGSEQRTANSEQQAAAYQAGVERRESGRIDPAEIAGQIVQAAGSAEGVTVLSKGGEQALSEADRQTLRFADAYGKAHGIRYIVVDTISGGRANAVYAGGNVVFVAADIGNADGGMSAAIGHDTWHYITETIRNSGDENAEQYVKDKTAELLGLLKGLDGYDYDARRKAIREANRKLGEDLDEDRLNEEQVGNGMFELITSDEAVRALAESDAKTGDNFVQKLKEALEAVVQRIRNAAARYGVAEARALVKAEEALAKFSEVANEAIRLADQARQSSTAHRAVSDQGAGISDQSDNRFMIREDYDQKITLDDIKKVQRLFPNRKNINSFTQREIDATAKWAYRFYKLMGPKSPFFQAWFGDWRAHDTSKENLSYVVKLGYAEKGIIKKDPRTVKNKDSGFKIIIDDTVFDDSEHYSNINRDKKQIFQLLSRIDEIAEKATYLYTETIDINKSKNKKGSAVFMHYLYCPVTFNDAPFIAKLEVEEYSTDGKTTAYNLQRIKMSDFQRAGFLSLLEENQENYALQTDALTVAQLYGFVKKYDKDFKPGREVSPAVLNEDGTPKMFWHGTRSEDFDSFDPARIGQNYGGYNVSGGGFDFTSSERRARLWGAKAKGTGNVRVFPVYLSAQKTFYSYKGKVDPELYELLPDTLTEAQKEEAMEFGATFHKVLDENGINFAEAIKKYGYDSYAQYPGDENVSVYSANQIKSAETGTDRANIGTFSRYENNMRFMARESEDSLRQERDRLNEEQTELNKKVEALKASDEYNSLFDRVVKQEDGALEELVRWSNESGLNDAVRKQTENGKRIETLNNQIDSLYSENAARNEQEAIKKSGLSEGDYFRKAAVKEFGYTPYFYDAGYLLPNGKLPNFSGEKGQHFGVRGEDHRGIGVIFDDTSGTDAMIRFMNQGNIRVMASTPGLDIYSGAEPTSEQYVTIRRMAQESAQSYYDGRGRFIVDFSDESGKVVGIDFKTDS